MREGVLTSPELTSKPRFVLNFADKDQLNFRYCSMSVSEKRAVHWLAWFIRYFVQLLVVRNRAVSCNSARSVTRLTRIKRSSLYSCAISISQINYATCELAHFASLFEHHSVHERHAQWFYENETRIMNNASDLFMNSPRPQCRFADTCETENYSL